MTNTAPLTTDAILDAFATAGSVLPRDALRQARENWPEVGPRLLTLLEDTANGAKMTDRVRDILLFGIYLMAERRETRAFRPLCILAAAPERIESILGDGVTEDLDAILVRTFDGDTAPLRALIENADADEYVRNSALDAMSVLTVTGRLDRDETGRYLRHLHATLQPQDANFVWVGWQQAVALLGYDELVPLVEDAFGHGWIEEGIMGVEDFRQDFRAAKMAADPLKAFPVTTADPDILDDIEAHMSTWASFSPKDEIVVPRLPALSTLVGQGTVHNPYRGVGRNDPCPCGSGKKFKKCCLDKAR
ncbi:MAG: DUF1186 domain-containing protein [Rhodopila sp.]